VSGGAPWTIYVPVQVTLRTVMLVARKPLFAEKVLTADDVATQDGESTRPDILTDPAQVVGKVLKQGIGAGQLIRQDMIREPYTVRQGQSVQVQVEGRGFRISTEGQAMGNAAEGQSVQIRTASGRFVAGTAGMDGTVRVAP
jgi:flagella basal body P-ring formation protein FlgA